MYLKLESLEVPGGEVCLARLAYVDASRDCDDIRRSRSRPSLGVVTLALPDPHFGYLSELDLC